MKSLIFLIFTVSLFAQNSGKVTYKVLMPISDKAIGSESELFFNNVKKKGEQYTYVLDFNQTQSHFYLNDMLVDNSTDGTEINNIALILAGMENFYDSNTQKSIDVNKSGVLLEGKTKINWVIFTESKMISNYVCYKAEFTKSYKSHNGNDVTEIITAWFAPVLPYQYGPKGYNGLPGLVLELNEKYVTFFVDVIDLNKKQLGINFPKGKVISIEEYMKNSQFLIKK